MVLVALMRSRVPLAAPVPPPVEVEAQPAEARSTTSIPINARIVIVSVSWWWVPCGNSAWRHHVGQPLEIEIGELGPRGIAGGGIAAGDLIVGGPRVLEFLCGEGDAGGGALARQGV